MLGQSAFYTANLTPDIANHPLGLETADRPIPLSLEHRSALLRIRATSGISLVLRSDWRDRRPQQKSWQIEIS